MIYFYRVIWLILSPIVDIWFISRLFSKKEDKSRLKERLGISSIIRPRGKLIWFHGSSVGETLSILPLINKLLEQDEKLNILVTSGTITSAKLMAEKLPPRAFHQYIPLDFYTIVSTFMEHWKPDLSIFVESEFWPELLHQAPNKVLINARISDRSFKRYGKHKWFIQTLLKGFKLCLAQSTQDEQRLKDLGIKNVKMSGNLKFDVETPKIDAKKIKELSAINDKTILVASSTHDPEETWLAAVHLKLKEKIPNLLTIIVPRHPARGNKLTEQLAEFGNIKQRSKNEQPKEDTDFYIADTIGEMTLWYTLAKNNGVVFMGKSLIPHGGQNPLEALKLNVPVICGPYMTNFKDMMDNLLKDKAIHQVEDIEALTQGLEEILTNKTKRNKLIKPIGCAMEKLAGATDYTADKIINLLGGFK